MKLRVLVLAGLTALNTGLIAAFVLRPSLLPPGFRDHRPDSDTAPGIGAAQRAPESSLAIQAEKPPPAGEELWSSLHSTDLATLVQRLREAGFPPAMVRAIADAEVERQFSPRLKELMRGVAETPYWRQDPGYFSGNSQLFETLNQIYRERSRVLRDLLGNDAYAISGVDPTAAQRRQYGDLSPAKIDLVRLITDDYSDMSGQIRSAMQGVALPEDREKLALLEREKRADLAAVLTPEELAEYEMRTSPITSRLRAAFSIMDAGEAEFRTIYAAHEPFKDTLYPSSGGITFYTSELMETRREASRQINEQLKAELGEARFADYQRSIDSDFQQLYRLGQRDNLPPETVVRAHEVRASTADVSIKIIEDPSLDSAAKRTALKQLAQTARTSLLSTLGPASGPAYTDNARWLMYLEQGRGISINPDGTLSSRSAPASRPPVASTPTP